MSRQPRAARMRERAASLFIAERVRAVARSARRRFSSLILPQCRNIMRYAFATFILLFTLDADFCAVLICACFANKVFATTNNI